MVSALHLNSPFPVSSTSQSTYSPVCRVAVTTFLLTMWSAQIRPLYHFSHGKIKKCNCKNIAGVYRFLQDLIGKWPWYRHPTTLVTINQYFEAMPVSIFNIHFVWYGLCWADSAALLLSLGGFPSIFSWVEIQKLRKILFHLAEVKHKVHTWQKKIRWMWSYETVTFLTVTHIHSLRFDRCSLNDVISFSVQRPQTWKLAVLKS